MSKAAVKEAEVVTEELEVEAAVETTEPEKFPLVHKGFGRYEVGGQKYPNKEEAEKARAQLLIQEQFANEYGDILPEGVEIKVIDRSLVFRGSLLEVPMNEVYLPDGDFNPYYSREWYYAWAARTRRSVSAYEALNYRRVTYQDLEAMVDDGVAPAHYLSLLQRDGDDLVFEDLILMRTPRVYWRQRKAEERAAVEARIRRTSDETARMGANPHMPREEIDLGL